MNKNHTIAFLGPKGTFVEEALLSAYPDLSDKQLAPYPTMQEVIEAVGKNEVDKGIVAIENSIEGSVNATLDTLVHGAQVLIENEIVTRISHNLLARPGVTKKQIKTVVSHPQAAAQCFNWVRKHLPDAVTRAANSTAEAARIVSKDDGAMAAIGTELAADLYGLRVLAKNIQDFKDNQTRFVVIGHEPAVRTGADKTSIVCFIHKDRPGSLLQILQEFAFRNINLTKIQSRPTRRALGEYCFFIDFEGHIEDEIVQDVLNCLRCKLREVKMLGSYPIAKAKKQ